MNRDIFLMMGIQASGKSTFCKKQIEKTGGTYISRDKIRFRMVKDDEDYFSHEKDVFNKFVRLIQHAIDHTEEDIYIDATHINIASRKKLLKNLRLNGERVSVVFINTPLEVCLERNQKRTGRERVPDSVIEDTYKRIVVPTDAEYPYWAVYTFKEGKVKGTIYGDN